MKSNVLVLVIISVIFFSCERDDICAEATPTTPQLIITFYDINNQDEPKAARQLEVIGLDDDDNALAEPVLSRTTTDSIAIPLRFQEENQQTISRFELLLNADFANEDDTTSPNTDKITITYSPEFVYVSRACGYKSIFYLDESTPFSRDGQNQGDDNTWIKSFEVNNQTITNENEAHIFIYH